MLSAFVLLSSIWASASVLVFSLVRLEIQLAFDPDSARPAFISTAATPILHGKQHVPVIVAYSF